MIGQERKRKNGTRMLALMGLSMTLSWTVFGVVTRDWVQDYRFSEKEALTWASNAAKGSSIPIELNERTLKWLRNYVGTSEGRQRMRLALANMEQYKGMIQGKLTLYNAPDELLAVPIVESGYKNLPQADFI